MEKINSHIFKAYDIRGKYPQEINEEVIEEIAPGIVRALNLFKKRTKPKLVIARDDRKSSPCLYNAIIKNLKKLKIAKIVPVGLTTTPMFYFLVKKLNAWGGIMITASHNPLNYNGIKIVDRNVIPVSGKEILRALDMKLEA